MAETKKAEAPPVSLRDMMRRASARPAVRQVELPPSGAFVAPRFRSERPDGWAASIPDLSKQSRLFAAIGPGGAGKTTLMRVFGELLAKAGLLDATLLAAADPGPRSLLRYFLAVDGPEGNSPAAGLDFMGRLFTGLPAAAEHGTVRALLDCGAGNTSLGAYLTTNRSAVRKLKAGRVALIGGYFFTPRVADLRTVLDLEAAGFQPDATLLVLNLAKAEGPASFDTLRGQAGYQALLARGAVEVFMPALSESLALRIEEDALPFTTAMDHKALIQRAQPAPLLDADQSDEVAGWWDDLQAELGPVVAKWIL